ncbi:hypothetical protein TWF281_003824 [Arthrobotrys megalospora]
MQQGLVGPRVKLWPVSYNVISFVVAIINPHFGQSTNSCNTRRANLDQSPSQSSENLRWEARILSKKVLTFDAIWMFRGDVPKIIENGVFGISMAAQNGFHDKFESGMPPVNRQEHNLPIGQDLGLTGVWIIMTSRP